MPSFLGGKSRGAFLATSVFSAGNHMTIVAFEKEVFKKLYLAKRLLDSTEVLLKLEKKHLISINEKKVQNNTGGPRRKVQVTKVAFKGIHICFLHGGELVLF